MTVRGRESLPRTQMGSAFRNARAGSLESSTWQRRVFLDRPLRSIARYGIYLARSTSTTHGPTMRSAAYFSHQSGQHGLEETPAALVSFVTIRKEYCLTF